MITYPIIFFSQTAIVMYDGFENYTIGNFDDQSDQWKYGYLFWNPNQPNQKSADVGMEGVDIVAEQRFKLLRSDYVDTSRVAIEPSKMQYKRNYALTNSSSASGQGVDLEKVEYYPFLRGVFDFFDVSGEDVAVEKFRYYFAFPKLYKRDSSEQGVVLSKQEYYHLFPKFYKRDAAFQGLEKTKSKYYLKHAPMQSKDIVGESMILNKLEYFAEKSRLASVDASMVSISFDAFYSPEIGELSEQKEEAYLQARFFGDILTP